MRPVSRLTAASGAAQAVALLIAVLSDAPDQPHDGQHHHDDEQDDEKVAHVHPPTH